jgi:hypothetical protein
MQKALYIISHYLLLFSFMLACWGIGRIVLRRAFNQRQDDFWLLQTLALALGLGIFIFYLQGLAVFGELRFGWIAVLFFAGIILGGAQLRTLPLCPKAWMKSLALREKRGLALILLLALATALDPLKPPKEWDELMYHLPHARQWALSGHLDVNTWLRYPWFPYNFDLLYSAALIAYDDVMSHLLHAAAGWLTALLVYQTGRRHFNEGVACGGAAIWLFLVQDEFGNAYIDMGVTFFVFAGCLAFYLWMEDRQQRIWLAAAAFLMGVAAGSKYQALTFLPIFAAAMLALDRRPGTIATALICLLIPSAYWYARNAVMTGDPFDPLGGKIFGFFDWNLGDYQHQFYDIRLHADWPHWLLWAALVSPLIKRCRESAFARAAMLFYAYSLLVWALTSRYPRYLMPVYPLLALFAAYGWKWMWEAGTSRISIFYAGRVTGIRLLPPSSAQPYVRYQTAGWTTILILVSITATLQLKSSLHAIAPTAADRDEILKTKVSGYPVLAYMRQSHFLKTYQFGLEGAIYYAPNPIYGDHFGPARYRDFASLKANELASKLKALGFDSMIVHVGLWPNIVVQADFDRYFIKVYSNRSVNLYRVAKDVPVPNISVN